MLIIKRKTSNHIDKYRSYKIFIDKIFIGNIENGEVKNIDISEGTHYIQIKIDWCTSNLICFNYSGNNITFICDNNIKGFKIPFLLLYISIFKSKYLTIWQEQKEF